MYFHISAPWGNIFSYIYMRVIEVTDCSFIYWPEAISYSVSKFCILGLLCLLKTVCYLRKKKVT